MNFLGFKGIIFDMDGTLINSSHVWTRVDEVFLGRRGIAVPADYFKAVSALDFKQAAIYTKEKFNLADSIEDMQEEWYQLAVKEYSETVLCKDGVPHFLKFLKDNGVKIALATASSEGLYKPVLQHNGIYDYFDFFACTTHVKRGKGFPDVYEYACENLDLKPNECAVFEDIIEGVYGANAGGFTSVAVLDEHYKADWVKMKAEADFAFCDYNTLLDENNTYMKIADDIENNTARIL